ncbi:MAG: hypothetical protein JWM87_1549 [Candidatus Eremiobacteraeota bacterium]|nr:hypothetical protein [Candidatus Eremiobacteraeota bacterium]
MTSVSNGGATNPVRRSVSSLQPTGDVTAANDPLEAIVRLRVPTGWSYRGPMTFFGEGVRIEGDAYSELAIADGEGRGTIAVPGLPGPGIGVHGELTFDIADVVVRVHAFVSMGGSSTSSARGTRTTFRVMVQEIDAVATRANACYSRETILGMRLHPNDKPTWQTRFATRIFGRRAVVAGYATHEPATEIDAVQVVYEGEPLAEDERHALYDVLRFLTAVRGGSFFREAFDVDGFALGFRFFGHGTCLRDGRRPVHLHPHPHGSQAKRVAREFPIMVEAMRGLRAQSPRALPATIHHYNDGSVQTYPTSKVRDMSVALEALGVVLMGRQARPTAIIDEFDQRVGPVRDAFEAAFGDLAADDRRRENYEWLCRKFANLNVASPREELFAALEPLDIGLSRTERRWISRMRNGVLHSGHHGDESIVDDLRVNAQAANLFANVYARALLRMLGFTGRYRDAVSGTRNLALNVAPHYPLLVK